MWKCTSCGNISIGYGSILCLNCNGKHNSAVIKSNTDNALINNSCMKCGSNKVILNANIYDTGDSSDGVLKIGFDKHPSAFIFRGRVKNTITGNICCSCGDITLTCNGDLQEMWDKYKNL